MKKKLLVALAFSAVLALSSCGVAATEPTPSPTVKTAPVPDSTSSTPPATITATATPSKAAKPTLTSKPAPSTSKSPESSDATKRVEPTKSAAPSPSAAKPSVATHEKASGTFYTTDALNVRTGPGTSYSVIDTLPIGEQLTVDAKSGTWMRISDSNAWVSGTYLSSVKPKLKTEEPLSQPSKKPTAAKSTGLEGKVRAILDNYGCSSSKIIMDDPRLGSYANGVADWHNNAVLIRSSTPADRLTYVVAHECMHLRQYKVYAGNVTSLQNDMNAIYGGNDFSGLEQSADCMTQKVGISVHNYTSNCSGVRGSAAESMLAGTKPS